MNRILVIGSGAGGAVTALELAQKGLDVMVVEEGQKEDQEPLEVEETEAQPLELQVHAEHRNTPRCRATSKLKS